MLPLCLGQATRLSEYLSDADKTYVADIELGVETDTYDAEGEVTARVDASLVSLPDLLAALRCFEGEFDQTPPLYSAIKRQGVPLYKLARRGEAFAPAPRRVRVDALRLLSFEPPILRLEIDCGKGFYVRSLAHDLGQTLGVGGSLAGLARTRVGAFGIAQAVDIDTLRAELEDGSWRERLWAPDEVLLRWEALLLGDENEGHLRNGRAISVSEQRPLDERGLCRAYGLDGSFLAIVRREGEGRWRPEKVFQPAR